MPIKPSQTTPLQILTRDKHGTDIGGRKTKRERQRTHTAASGHGAARRCAAAGSYNMPRGDAHLASGFPKRGHGHSYITAEEAAGIGILIVILGISLLLGCWYCRWRRGYQRLKDKSFHVGPLSALPGRCQCEVLGYQNKLPLQENNQEAVVPDAPPAYEKLSAEQSPPPYSP